MGRHLIEDHGPDTAAALGGLFAHIGRFAPYFVDSAFGPPLDIIEVIAAQPTPEERHDFAQMWYGSTMDTVRRFLTPDQGRCIQGSLAAMSIDAFDGGPWTLVSDARATGVQLRDGTTISADAVLSSLDP